MRATWPRIVAGVCFIAAMIAAVGLPPTLGLRGDDDVSGIEAPPGVSRSVVRTEPFAPPAGGRQTTGRGSPGPAAGAVASDSAARVAGKPGTGSGARPSSGSQASHRIAAPPAPRRAPLPPPPAASPATPPAPPPTEALTARTSPAPASSHGRDKPGRRDKPKQKPEHPARAGDSSSEDAARGRETDDERGNGKDKGEKDKGEREERDEDEGRGDDGDKHEKDTDK